MAINGFSKEVVKDNTFEEMKKNFTEQELYYATGYYRTAYRSIESQVFVTDKLVEQLKISALLKVERLRKI